MKKKKIGHHTMPTYGNNFSSIKNKQKRQEVYQKSKKEKKKAKKERQVKRKREEEELGDKAPPRQVGVFFFSRQHSLKT